MTKANVYFTFDRINKNVLCMTDDTMLDICKNISTKIGKYFNSLIFIYEAEQINFDLKLSNYQDLIDNKKNILVYACPKCEQKNQLNKQKLDEINLSNNNIIDSINGIKYQIDNIIKVNTTNQINCQLKNIINNLNIVNDEIINNEQRINNLFNDNKNKNNFKNKNNINNEKNNINKNDSIENIKSSVIYKRIFSFVNEKKKLKSIKYNKNLQNKINISLNNYKYYKGIYIIYEKTGIGKEYDGEDDRLLYEGEYLNGERNGKGKEYNDGILIFEGDY